MAMSTVGPFAQTFTATFATSDSGSDKVHWHAEDSVKAVCASTGATRTTRALVFLTCTACTLWVAMNRDFGNMADSEGPF
jgi:hypothetical protein